MIVVQVLMILFFSPLAEKERIPYLLGFDPNARAQQDNTTVFLLANRVLAIDATTEICPEQNPIVHSRGIDGPKRIH